MFRNLIRTRWFKYISPYIFMPHTTKPWRISRGSQRRILKDGKRKANRLEQQQGGKGILHPNPAPANRGKLFRQTHFSSGLKGNPGHNAK